MESYETILNYIQTTTTKSGLEVIAYLNEVCYEKGMKLSNEQIEKLVIAQHSVQPKRSYTLRPEQPRIFELDEVSFQRTSEQNSNLLTTQKPEVIFA